MSEDFARKYGAARFDPDDANDRLAEAVRKAVLASVGEIAVSPLTEAAPRQAEMILAGALVGLTQTMQSCVEGGDETDAAIRASIIEVTAWAVDAARAFSDKPPLADV